MSESMSLRAAAFPFLLGVCLVMACGGGGEAPAEGPKQPSAAADSGKVGRPTAGDSIDHARLDGAAPRRCRAADGPPESGGALVANGTITYDANRVSVIASRAEGRIVAVRADLGQAVRAGDVLAILESPEVGQIRGRPRACRGRRRGRAAQLRAREAAVRAADLAAEGTARRRERVPYRGGRPQRRAVASFARSAPPAADGGTFGLARPSAARSSSGTPARARSSGPRPTCSPSPTSATSGSPWTCTRATSDAVRQGATAHGRADARCRARPSPAG